MPGLPFENLPATQERIDVFSMLDQRFEEDLLALDESLNTELQQLDWPLTHQKTSWRRQYDIKADYLEPLRRSDPEKYTNSMTSLNQQFEVKNAQLEGKQAPMKEELQLAYKRNKLELEQQHSQQKIRLQQIQDLVEAGHLSAEVGIQEQLSLLGISVPLTQLQPPTLTQQFGQLETLENKLERELEYHWAPPTTGGVFGFAKPVMYSPTGFEEEFKEATPEEKYRHQEILNQLGAIREAKLDILDQISPQKAFVQRRARRLTGVAERQTTTFANEIKESKLQYLKKIGQLALPLDPFGAKWKKPDKPTPEGLRQKGTRAAYKQGQKLGYWD